jgi:hypothetical protein
MQTLERPRFRQDLVAEPIEDGASRFIDVADPDSGNLYRFYEVEYSLACAMDGERDVAGIVKWAEEELGLKPSAKEVQSVIATLGDLGYLESGAAAAAAVNAAAAAAEAPPPARPEPVEAPRAAAPPAAARPKTPAAGVKKQPDAELGRGVVTGGRSSGGTAPSPAADLELGTAGGRAPARAEELPSGGDFELGAPGATSGAKQPAARKGGDDFALGASGAGAVSNPALSTDLAADMAISPADVKEAVRASQVMKSVDIPPELAAELEPPKPIEAPRPAKQAEAPKPVAAAKPVETKPAETKPAEVKAPKPVEMPTERPVLPKAPPSSGPSPILIGLLVLVLLAAGAFVVYKFVLKKDATPQKKVEAPVAPMPPQPPASPPVETAKLASEQPAPEDIKPAGAATIATIVTSDSTVKAGDPIARLAGYKPISVEVATLQKDVDTAKAGIAKATQDRDAAQTAGNKAGVTAAETKLAGLEKTLATNEGKLATKTAALDAFLIKSPAAGKITAIAKPNAKVTPTDIIATLTRDPITVATFKSTGEVAPDTHVLLAIKGSEQKLSCTVVATGGDGTKIACPKDAAPDGTEVTYAGVDTSAPAPSETKPADGSAAPADGSAAGSAAPADGSAGSAAAADGSAAAEKAEKAPARPRPQPKQPAPKQPAPDKPAEPAAPAEPAPAGSGT